MRVRHRPLILHEVLRLLHFADVVVQGPHPREKRVGADAVRRRLGKVCDLEGMVERSRRAKTQFLQERPVRIRQLQKGEVRRNVENALQRPQEQGRSDRDGGGNRRVGQVGRDSANGKVDVKPGGGQDQGVSDEDQPSTHEELPPIFNVPHAKDSEGPGEEGRERVFQIQAEHLPSCERQQQSPDKGDSGIENDREQDRGEGHRHHV